MNNRKKLSCFPSFTMILFMFPLYPDVFKLFTHSHICCTRKIVRWHVEIKILFQPSEISYPPRVKGMFSSKTMPFCNSRLASLPQALRDLENWLEETVPSVATVDNILYYCQTLLEYSADFTVNSQTFGTNKE